MTSDDPVAALCGPCSVGDHQGCRGCSCTYCADLRDMEPVRIEPAKTTAADYRWVADILRACHLGMKDWECARHGQKKKLKDAIRYAEKRYIKAMGWR